MFKRGMRRRGVLGIVLAAVLGLAAGCDGVADIVAGSLQLAFGIVEAAD